MTRDSEREFQTSALKWGLLSIIFNIIFSVVKGIVGILGNSSALIADAIESTADIFASGIIYLGLRYAHKPPDEEHPYGHGRIETITTFAVVGFLLVSAGIIIFNSIQNMFQAQVVPETYTLYVLVVIIISKEVLYRIMKHYGKASRSSSLITEATHHRADAFTSLAAFVGIGIAVVFGEAFAKADEIAALIAAGVIIYNAYRLFKPTYKEIMNEQDYEELMVLIRIHTLEISEIIDTEKCYIRKMGGSYYVDLHIIVNGDKTVRDGHEIAHRLKDHLREALPPVKDILIHVEPEEELKKL